MPASARCLCGFLILAPEERVGSPVVCGRCGLSLTLPGQFEFPCPACRKAVRTGVDTVGMRLACPACGRDAFVPEPGLQRSCPFCREALQGAPERCRACGERLRPPEPKDLLARWMSSASRTRLLKAERIDPNPFQPRERILPEGLWKLTQSVARFGILVPLLVRPAGRRFQVIAGSRRLEAARRLGMRRVPAVPRVLTDREACEIAYLENIQREDLDPMERAVGLQNVMLEQASLPQEELARRLGLGLAEVKGLLATVEMPLYLRRAFATGRLSLRQVRSLAALAPGREEGEFQKVIQAVLSAALSDEETEALAGRLAVSV